MGLSFERKESYHLLEGDPEFERPVEDVCAAEAPLKMPESMDIEGISIFAYLIASRRGCKCSRWKLSRRKREGEEETMSGA